MNFHALNASHKMDLKFLVKPVLKMNFKRTEIASNAPLDVQTIALLKKSAFIAREVSLALMNINVWLNVTESAGRKKAVSFAEHC